MGEFARPLETIMAGTDPLAVDATAWRIIESERARRGLPSLAEAGRPPRYIATAAQLGLGVADEDAITVAAV